MKSVHFVVIHYLDHWSSKSHHHVHASKNKAKKKKTSKGKKPPASLFFFSTTKTTHALITSCLSAAFAAFYLHAKKVFWWSESMTIIWEHPKEGWNQRASEPNQTLSWVAAHLLIECCFMSVLCLKPVQMLQCYVAKATAPVCLLTVLYTSRCSQ